MTPRRVLLTTDTVGGVWRYVMVLARGLTDRGIEPVIVTLGPPPSASQRNEAEASGRTIVTDLPLDWTAASSPALADAADAVADLAQTEHVDAAHLHAPAFAASVRWNVPVVSVVHSCLATWWDAVRGTALPNDMAWRVAATGRGLGASDAVIAPTVMFARAVEAAYGCERPITAIHNGLPTPAMPTAARERAALAAGRLWDEGKNLAVLDAAAAHLSAPVYAAGSVAGPNNDARTFTHLRLLGTLGQAALLSRYATASVFVAPALYEPFGLSVLEAAQAGMALVLADIPTFRELWDGAAVFVDPRDPGSLAEAINRSLDDPCAMANAAKARSDCYTATRLVERTLSVHRGVSASRASVAA